MSVLRDPSFYFKPVQTGQMVDGEPWTITVSRRGKDPLVPWGVQHSSGDWIIFGNLIFLAETVSWIASLLHWRSRWRVCLFHAPPQACGGRSLLSEDWFGRKSEAEAFAASLKREILSHPGRPD